MHKPKGGRGGGAPRLMAWRFIPAVRTKHAVAINPRHLAAARPGALPARCRPRGPRAALLPGATYQPGSAEAITRPVVMATLTVSPTSKARL